MSVTPTKIGGATKTSSSTSITIPLTSGASVGDDVWAGFTFTATSNTFSSVTDTKSNTWTIDVNITSSNNDHLAFVHSKLTTALTTSDTITGTVSLSSTRLTGSAFLVSGGAMASSPFDQTVNAAITTTAISIGPTATLAQPDELCFLLAHIKEAAAGETVTAGSGWTALSSAYAESGSNNFLAWVEWLETSSTAGVTGTGTISATPTSGRAAIMTYKVATAVTPLIQSLMIKQSLTRASVI